MIIASLVIFSLALILTLTPAVRYHAGFDRYQFQHWIGVIVWCLLFSILNHQTNRKLPQSDPYILPVVALLSGIGLLTIWRLFPGLGLRQTVWLGIGCLLTLTGFFFPTFLQYLRRYKYIWLMTGLLLTGLTIFLGTNPQGEGSARWLSLFGIHFQPSEPLKILLIVYLAGYFTDQITISTKNFESFLPTVIITGIALLLLVFQGDLGTASIFLLVYLAMLFTSGGRRWLLWLTPVLMFLAGLSGYFLSDIVKLRINTWVKPFSDPGGTSYQVIQSIIAIAEGGLMGTGQGLGSPGLIPVAVSDFIFSALAEEIGLMGITVIILLYIILIYRSLRIAITTNTSFHRYLSLGLTFLFGAQSILIIGGNIGLLPLTGVTLPFLSYGGSSLLVSFMGMLILLTISHQTVPKEELSTIKFPRYALIGSILIAALIVEIIAASLLGFWFSPSLVNRPENPRWVIDDRFVERGEIVDRNNQVIITNSGQTGSFNRTSHHIPLYPVIGYTNPLFGQTGIEASMFNYLRGNSGYPYSTLYWQRVLYNQPPTGLDIRLTIDLNLQQSADTLLAEHPGAIVIINASSGEILAMASHPYYDAADLQENWDELILDERAPLLNRATQGLYPPGATLFPFIVAIDPDYLWQEQETQEKIENRVAHLNCALNPDEPLTWHRIITNGCLGVQKAIAADIGSETLLDLYSNLGFFTSPRLHLPVVDAVAADLNDLNAFFNGEGNFKVSPLQMAMAASTISSQGILPGPRIVNAFNDPIDGWTTLPKLQPNSDALNPVSADQVNDLLKLPNFPYWQVLSTVSAEDQQTITWFIAGTSSDWQGQPLAVVVVLEHDEPILARVIGRALLKEAIRFSE